MMAHPTSANAEGADASEQDNSNKGPINGVKRSRIREVSGSESNAWTCDRNLGLGNKQSGIVFMGRSRAGDDVRVGLREVRGLREVLVESAWDRRVFNQ